MSPFPPNQHLTDLHTAMVWDKDNEASLRVVIQNEDGQQTPVYLTDANGNPITATNQLPVTLGSNSITITGDVNVGTTVNVASTPSDPVHVHLTEVGTSGILTTPYLPVNGNVWVNGGQITITSLPEVEIKNDSGNPIPVSANTSPNSDTNPIYVKGVGDASFFAPTQSDAFGRLRVSEPFTLWDSFHRYQDNGKISEYTATGGSSAHDAASGTILMSVSAASGSKVYRESSKVFAYQPGKSLQTFQTWCMATPKANLRQRIGYFDTSNGIFIEQNGLTLNLVRRTSAYGSIQEYRVPQSDWNVNTLIVDGLSTLHVDRSQIFWMDIEWLGVGSVRCGFVIDGQFVHVHTFNHANHIDPITGVGLDRTYMTTACLPVRAEIENTGVTSGPSSFRLICTSIVSEGGFSEIGRPKSIGHGISSPFDVANVDTLYPLVSIRLKSTRLEGLVLPKSFSIAVTGNANYKYYLIKGGTTTAGSWVDAGATDSSVEYNLNGNSFTGGTVIDVGYIINANQGTPTPQNTVFPFKYQLERNTFTSTGYEFTVAIECASGNQDAWAAINWEEMT